MAFLLSWCKANVNMLAQITEIIPEYIQKTSLWINNTANQNFSFTFTSLLFWSIKKFESDFLVFILSLASRVDLQVFTLLSKYVESFKSEAITLGICKDDWHLPLHLRHSSTERMQQRRTSGEAVWFFSLLLHWKWIEFSLQRRVLVALDFNQVTCSQSLKAYKAEMSRWAWGECATRFVKL